MNYTWNEALVEGIALAHGSDLPTAHTILGRALEASPRSASGWRAMSMLLRRMRRMEEARAAAERAVVLEPEDPANRGEFVHVLLDERDIHGAEIEARKAIETFPAEGRSHLALALVLRDAGRLDEALVSAKRAVSLRPADASASHLLANVRARLRGGESAGHGAFSAGVRFASAQVLLRNGSVDEALAAVRDLLLIEGTNPHVHALMGHILARKNDLHGAEAAFRVAVGIDRAFTPFRISLAHALAGQGKTEEALALLREMATEGNRDPQVRALIDQLLGRQNARDGAAAA